MVFVQPSVVRFSRIGQTIDFLSEPIEFPDFSHRLRPTQT